ncbi:MAG: hypothetical protein OXP11_16785, partial [Gammaproteobacteria bacterium]|nr:hypothetical protein [Gammaproteobacteria bacterium]
NLAYQWDALGNLKSRTSGEGASALVETFGYDGLNRLRTHQVGSGAVRSTAYDGYGNVRSRTGVGTYSYGDDSGGSGRPHAVASVTENGVSVTHGYDANGSLTSSSDGRTVSYAAFGKATSISNGGHTSAFAHGPDRSRFKRTDTDDMGRATTTLYIGSVERVHPPRRDGDGAPPHRRDGHRAGGPCPGQLRGRRRALRAARPLGQRGPAGQRPRRSAPVHELRGLGRPTGPRRLDGPRRGGGPILR